MPIDLDELTDTDCEGLKLKNADSENVDNGDDERD